MTMMKKQFLAAVIFLLMPLSHLAAQTLVAPTAKQLKGGWHYATVQLVADKAPKDAALLQERIDSLLLLAIGKKENCALSFEDERHCTFGVGKKVFHLTWKLDATTCVFNAAVAFFKVSGKLYLSPDSLSSTSPDNNDRNICLLYPNGILLMMMRYMCPRESHGYIKEIDGLLSAHPGVSVAVEFERNK